MKGHTIQNYVVKVLNPNIKYCERCKIEQYDKYIATGEIKLVVWNDGKIVWNEMI